MANLLKYKSRRSMGQNAAIAFGTLIFAFFAFGVLPTQWFAAQYHYDPNLGEALFRLAGIGIYAPTDWVIWGWRLADIPAIKSNVHVMLILGSVSVFLAILFSVFVAHMLGRHTDGMDGLHGTAHFAEREDLDRTGFIDAANEKDYRARGVVVGSIMLDPKGKVIHPHHAKYGARYKPVMERGKGRRFYRKVPTRDSNNRPMYAPRKSIVRKVKLLRDGGNTHIFAFCPTRSGKGVGLVIPTLLTWVHSVFVNDPKGEAHACSAGCRKALGQLIVKFEPACQDGTAARWNPLDEIRTFTERDVSDSQMVMGMICDPSGKGLEEYFEKAASEFLTGLALHMRYSKGDGSLAGCAKFLGDPLWESDKQMYTEMMGAEHDPDGKMPWTDTFGKPTKTHPMVANAAKTMLNKEDKDRSGVLSTAKSFLSLYLDPIVARNTSSSDFLVRDLMMSEKPVSLYYVVAPSDMERLVPLTRLFYALFIRRNASEMHFDGGRSVASYKHPLLMIIDEATSLKKLPILQEALGYVAGYGIRMFMLVQDITQVEELYGDKQSFDSGAETRIVYAPNKIETAEKLARMSGKTTVTEENASNSRELIGIKPGSVSLSTSKTARDLITADEFMMLHDQDMVVFIKGHPPVYGRKAFYYEDKVMLGRAKMPAPKLSDRLRGVEDVVVIEKAAVREATPGDKWAAAREAMKARVDAHTAPAVADVVGKRATSVREPVATESLATRQTSRYAAAAQVMTDQEKEQVRALVEDVALMDRVVNISAF